MERGTKFWVSWYDRRYGEWELHSPWWVTGERCDDALTICAAIIARDEKHAKELICEAHDSPTKIDDLEWRFIESRGDGWTPFSERFPRRDWMQWPLPKEPTQ